VKLIEQFYHVKHQNIPLLARASMKAVKTAAKIKGGEYKKLAEGRQLCASLSLKSRRSIRADRLPASRAGCRTCSADQWSALVQTLAPKTEEQTYVYVRDAGKNFHVLVITIERREGEL
jgi:hypothetical protein